MSVLILCFLVIFITFACEMTILFESFFFYKEGGSRNTDNIANYRKIQSLIKGEHYALQGVMCPNIRNFLSRTIKEIFIIFVNGFGSCLAIT